MNQKVWGTRIMLESYFHPYSLFGTLTYDDDHVPMCRDGVPQLHKPDTTRFIERLRYRTRNHMPLRYLVVGEYGSETWRPHYHFILFGHDASIEAEIADSWTDDDGKPMGFHQLGELNFDRALYTAQYCIKKMTRPGDEKLQGRLPEFMRCSTKPGLGEPAVGWLADTMGKRFHDQDGNIDYGPQLRLLGDVFNTVRIEGRIMPLGRYMRRKLRDALGLSQDPNERAYQLGRYDHGTGEIFDPNLPKEYHPQADLSDINSPWRRYAESQAAKAKAEKAAAIEAKLSRQGQLFKGARL